MRVGLRTARVAEEPTRTNRPQEAGSLCVPPSAFPVRAPRLLVDLDHAAGRRPDVPLDQLMSMFVSARSFLSSHYSFLDFGNGRISLGLDELTDAVWLQIIDLSNRLNGHALVEKAPDSFKQNNDVFGLPGSAWPLMHTLKKVLDPGHIFAPGRLPGKV